MGVSNEIKYQYTNNQPQNNRLMGLFFIIIFLIYASVNSYIFYRTRQALPALPTVRTIYLITFIIIFCTFFAALLGRNFFPLGLQRILYFIGTTWLAIMLYLTLYLLATDLIHLLDHFLHFFPKALTAVLFHRIQLISGYTIVMIVLIFGYIQFRHPVIVEKDLVIHKDGGKYTDLKIVAISDLHLGITINKGRLQRYVQLINEQKPDLILIAGDIVDNSALPLNKEKMYEEINQLQAPLGIYFCPGNHEYISGIKNSLAFLKKTKINLLIDTAQQVNDSFWIIGRDDRSVQNRLDLEQLVAGINPEQTTILLDHQPYDLEKAEKNGIDLQISGHTHHGQMWPISLIVEKIFEVGHGYKQKGNTHIYVSSGLALWGPEFRVGTQSELVIFNLHFEK
jgi:predicted MPP superfamily phosphohydrolase